MGPGVLIAEVLSGLDLQTTCRATFPNVPDASTVDVFHRPAG